MARNREFEGSLYGAWSLKGWTSRPQAKSRGGVLGYGAVQCGPFPPAKGSGGVL